MYHYIQLNASCHMHVQVNKANEGLTLCESCGGRYVQVGIMLEKRSEPGEEMVVEKNKLLLLLLLLEEEGKKEEASNRFNLTRIKSV